MADILLAEDDQGTRDLVCRALQMDGHAVTIAEDGSEALAAASSRAFDALIADVNMPGIDGITLSRRTLERSPNIRLVLISANLDMLQQAADLEANGAKLLTKPFTLEQMRSAVQGVLAG